MTLGASDNWHLSQMAVYPLMNFKTQLHSQYPYTGHRGKCKRNLSRPQKSNWLQQVRLILLEQFLNASTSFVCTNKILCNHQTAKRRRLHLSLTDRTYCGFKSANQFQNKCKGPCEVAGKHVAKYVYPQSNKSFMDITLRPLSKEKATVPQKTTEK